MGIASVFLSFFLLSFFSFSFILGVRQLIQLSPPIEGFNLLPAEFYVQTCPVLADSSPGTPNNRHRSRNMKIKQRLQFIYFKLCVFGRHVSSGCSTPFRNGKVESETISAQA